MGKENQLDNFLKVIVNSSFLVLIGLILSKIISYIYRIIIARYFGPEVYGVFSLAVIISGWFITFAGLGLAEGVIRYLILYENKKNGAKSRFVFKYIKRVTLISSIILGFALFIFAGLISERIFDNPDLTIFLRWFSLIVPLTAMSHLYLSSLRAYRKIGWYSFILNVLQNGVKVLVILLLLIGSVTVSSILISYTLAVLAMLICGWLVLKKTVPDMYKKETKSISEKEKSKIKKSLIHYSLPLLFFNIMYVLFYWLDSVFLGYYRGATPVGLYNSAVPLALLLATVPEIFVQVFLPIITKSYVKGDHSLVTELTKQVAKWIFIINLPILVVLLLFPTFILNLLFGPSFVAAANALRILAVGSFLSTSLVISQQVAYAQGKSRLFVKCLVIAAIINVFLNVVLIPRDYILGFANQSGLVGASIAAAFSFIILNLMISLSLTGLKIETLPFRRKMANVVLAMIPAAAFFYFYSTKTTFNLTNFLIGSLIFGLIYLALIFVFKAFDKNDLLIVNAFARKIKKFK